MKDCKECEKMDARLSRMEDDSISIRNEILLLRNRTHSSENSIANNLVITTEIQANMNWIIKKIDDLVSVKEKINSRLDRLNDDIVHQQRKELEDEIKENSEKLGRIKKFILSNKFVLFVVAVLYISDKISFAHYADNIISWLRGLTF
jgi:chromosome segregation ATPase